MAKLNDKDILLLLTVIVCATTVMQQTKTATMLRKLICSAQLECVKTNKANSGRFYAPRMNNVTSVRDCQLV